MASSNPPSTTSDHPAYSALELHTPTTLLASPHLPTLFRLINYAFDRSHNKDGSSHLPPSEKARLQTHTQLGEEVGPNGFILVMLQTPTASPPSPAAASTETFLSQAGHRIIGTASAKPYHPNAPIASCIDSTNATHLFKRPPPSNPPPEAEHPQWELLAMAVDPALQGHGLATQLTNLTLDEIKRRCGSDLRSPTSNPSEESESSKEKVTLLLSTMKDTNERYNLNGRGWTTTETRSFPPGTMGSRDGFSVVEMCKCIAL